MNSKKTIGYLTLPHPVSGQKKVLDEPTFRSLYLQSDLTIQQVTDEYGVSLKCMYSSVKYYKQFFLDEIKEKASRNYSACAYRRLPYIRPEREVHVDKDVLISLLASGLTEWAIGEKLGVAAQTIRKNLKSYGLPSPSKRVFSLSDEEWRDLEWANQLAPGLTKNAFHGIDDPSEFLHSLYDAFVGLCKILWTVQRVGSRLRYYTERGIIQRDHIGWRMNKQEIILSEKLRELGIHHIREYYWAKAVGKGFSADIYIPEVNLLIEINGNVHNIGFVINRDEEKIKLVKKLGYKRLMFLSGEVDKELDQVILKIQKEMKR